MYHTLIELKKKRKKIKILQRIVMWVIFFALTSCLAIILPLLLRK